MTRPTIRDGKAYYKLADIRPHPENYNRHSPEQVKLLKASLEKYGQTKPVVLWRNAEFNGQNGIPGDKWLSLAGEGLCEAAMQLGWQEVWGNDRSDLPVLEARAYLAVDNETARQADPDIDALSQLLAAVHAEDKSLAALAAGGEDELRRLLEMAGQEPIDALALPDLEGWATPAEALRIIIEFGNEDERAKTLSHLGLEEDEGRVRYAYKETVLGRADDGK